MPRTGSVDDNSGDRPAVSLYDLAITPRDVSADNLGLLLDAPAPRPLVELVRERPGAAPIRLGVLGASHVVVIGDGLFTEQVSCETLAAGGQPLPAAADRGRYTFQSSTRIYHVETFRRMAGLIREKSVADPESHLCGVFPTDEAALTALTVEPIGADGWAWLSRHLYPDETGGTIVKTESRWFPSSREK